MGGRSWNLKFLPFRNQTLSLSNLFKNEAGITQTWPTPHNAPNQINKPPSKSWVQKQQKSQCCEMVRIGALQTLQKPISQRSGRSKRYKNTYPSNRGALVWDEFVFISFFALRFFFVFYFPNAFVFWPFFENTDTDQKTKEKLCFRFLDTLRCTRLATDK